jgi:uncharacterized protein YlzI (FlbEa/FlbD family)
MPIWLKLTQFTGPILVNMNHIKKISPFYRDGEQVGAVLDGDIIVHESVDEIHKRLSLCYSATGKGE